MRAYTVIILSLFVALLLSLMPLPVWAEGFRPQWVLLVVMYWVLAVPHRVSIGVPWAVGVVLDLLSGNILGEHALALAIVGYLAHKFHRRIRVAPLWQQGISVSVLTLIYLGILYAVQVGFGQAPVGLGYWAPVVTSLLLWPWHYVILRDCRRRFDVS